jgi:hypothetical protein
LRIASQSFYDSTGLESGRPEEAAMCSWVVPTAYLLGAGWFFAACIILGVLLGRWADAQTGLEPVFTLVGIILGLAVAVLGGIRMLLPLMDRIGNDSSEKK